MRSYVSLYTYIYLNIVCNEFNKPSVSCGLDILIIDISSVLIVISIEIKINTITTFI